MAQVLRVEIDGEAAELDAIIQQTRELQERLRLLKRRRSDAEGVARGSRWFGSSSRLEAIEYAYCDAGLLLTRLHVATVATTGIGARGDG